ncbi:HNH endonuclease [Acetobacter oeni]|nr:HNH endonuclease [Acetobacter oeni]
MPSVPERYHPIGYSADVTRRTFDERRGSASSRGYDRKWRDFRSWFLRRHPLCLDCSGAGRLKPATEVHHIQKLRDAPERRLDEGNCMPLCQACHSARTGRGE